MGLVGCQAHQNTSRCSPSSPGWAAPSHSWEWVAGLAPRGAPGRRNTPRTCRRGFSSEVFHQPGQE